MRRPILALLAVLLLPACHDQARGGGGGARDEIRAVGSSTVYPFTTLVAERFVAEDPDAAAPVIETTGTGAGLRLFCAGLGAAFPDIADASRRITLAEYRRCEANGVGPLLEVPIGLDGVAFAQSHRSPALRLTPALIYRALAATPNGRPNPARNWSDLDPALPRTPILVYGPPATSGTRDALIELILLPGCREVDPGAPRAQCTRLREDGAYADMGENDNFIVQKLAADPNALGLVGYSYLEENAGTARGVPLDGVSPSYLSIASGRYPGSRPLFLYVKKNHLTAVPGLREFLRVYARNWGADGLLVRRGLIASPPATQARATQVIARELALDPAGLA